MTHTTVEALRTTRRLGVDLSDVTDVETAMVRADLNWGLDIMPADNLDVGGPDGEKFATSIPGMRLVMRDDTHTVLGVVGNRYEPVDNKSVFSLSQYFLAQGATFKEGGSLDHGRRCFMRFDLPDTSVSLLNGKDLVTFGVVIKASHDGTGNVSAALEGTRLICANGMTAKMQGLPHIFTVRHTANAQTRMAEAEAILSGAALYARGFAAAAQHMLDTPMSKEEFTVFADELFPQPDAESKRATTIWENRRANLLNLFRFAATNEAGRGTAWAGYNALTEFLDWESPIRSTDGSPLDVVRARRHFDATNQDAKDLGFALLNA